ncbi:MAG: D-fructose-6-phosphate amidotransferase [Fluviicola sp.]|nr:MAG: D-fructose-6-phosphate amidotransferase [Fluviicola sp.]
MSAYAILDLEIFDVEKLQEYKNIAPEIIKKFGGKIIVRGGEPNIVEGNWNPKRVVIIEFPSYEIANDWWNSEDYRKATELRNKGANTNAIIIDGI